MLSLLQTVAAPDIDLDWGNESSRQTAKSYDQEQMDGSFASEGGIANWRQSKWYQEEVCVCIVLNSMVTKW
jgi:hypothetical protein